MSVRRQVDSWLRQFEKDFITQNRIEVSQGALLHNFDTFSDLTNKQAIPVLKGNAYGHGIELVAKALRHRDFPYIAVDGYFEALRVREVSKQPVLIMGAIRSENYKRIKYEDFAFVVQDDASIIALAETGKQIAVHLECNTGMNRYGADLADVEKLTSLILRHKNLRFEGVMSHLADSDGDDPKTIEAAVRKFDDCIEIVRGCGADPSFIHIGQSAGSLRETSKYTNSFRLGLSLYGLNPFPKSHSAYKRLKGLWPALRLVSTVTKVTSLQPGDKVSYNYIYQAPKNMEIAVIPLGYYEGLSRALSNTGSVALDRKYVPIVGRICMNHTMINVEGFNAKVGDEVIVYSNNPADHNSIDAIADTYDLFKYSLLTSLSSDVRRILVE